MKRKRSEMQGSRLDVAVCRVCMCAEGTVLLFDGRGSDEQFYYCTLLRASDDDGLPDKLCRQCAKKMRVAYDFRFQAIYAEQCFRKTIFPPTLENDASEGSVGCERDQLYLSDAALGEQLVLDENMQEIGKLLAKSQNDLEEKPQPWAKLAESVEYAGETGKHERDPAISDCESVGPSDHFVKVFSTTSAQVCGADMCIEEIKENDDQRFSPKHAVNEETYILNRTNLDANDNVTSVPSQPLVSVVPNENLVLSGSIAAALNDESITRIKQQYRKRKTIKVECNICGTTFAHMSSLKQHLLKHSGERPFRCEFCDKTFTRSTILNTHRRLHTGERPYRCSECVRCFVTKMALNQHKKREHKEQSQQNSDECRPSYTCSVCSSWLCSKRALQTHMRKHQTNTETKGVKNSARNKRKSVTQKPRRDLKYCTVKYCHICQRGFPSKWELEVHQQEHEMAPLFECEICHCTWEKKFHLICHLHEHDNADALIQQCVQRSALHTQAKVVQSEVEIEEDAKSLTQRYQAKNTTVSDALKCRLCGNSLPHLSALKLHMQSHSSGRPFKCEVCNKTFTKKSVLALHRRLHALTDNLSHECPLCAAACRTTNILWQHLKTVHTQQLAQKEEISCRLCAASFATDALLKAHWVELHSEVPLAKLHLVCNYCQQQFLLLGQFLQHLPADCRGSVNSSAVFECDKCKLHFKEKYKLLFHMELHRVSDQACRKCGQTFGLRKLLLRHVKRAHVGRGNLDYQCPQCTEALYDLRDLKQHLSEAHAVPFDAGELNACDLCGVDCETALQYYRHMHERHDAISKTCDECGKYFSSRRAFDKHILAHFM